MIRAHLPLATSPIAPRFAWSPPARARSEDRFESAAVSPAAIGRATIQNPTPYRWTVRSGETLTALGERFGTYPQVIASENGMSDGAEVEAGQSLALPGWQLYTVQKGDTLQGILDRLTLGERTAAQVAKANELNDANQLREGQPLAIPAAALRNPRPVGDALARALELGAFVGQVESRGMLTLNYERGSVDYDQRRGKVDYVNAPSVLPGADPATSIIRGRVVDAAMLHALGRFQRNDMVTPGDIRVQFERGTVHYSIYSENVFVEMK